LAERAVDRIPGADLIAEESPVAHYGVFSIINHKVRDAKFVAFVEDVARLNKQQQFVAKNYRVPGVASEIDPNKSFWKEFVTYPFPVKYATVKDGNGVSWQIGYMDEYAGTDPNPPVLIVIHGKGAFAGHYGNVIKQAVENGLRVIAPDLPHYGMSGPGNLDKNPARSMQDMRDVVHELVVNQLGVKQAYYLGHSLGGQVALGYALSWPDAVRGLILEAPAGLEEYPADVPIAPGKTAKLFDPAIGRDFNKWKQVWDQTGVLASEIARNEQSIRDFYYFKKRDPVTGAVSKAKSGYFMNDSEYARFHTEQRVGLTKGNPKELEQWANVFVYDIYGMVVELRKDDPKNLYQRLTQIKAPIFLAFGAKEPFIPGTSLNGLKDLGGDIIVPFIERMAVAGNRPIVKIYPDTGHFIHTDNPIQFSADVIDFVRLGNVVPNSPVAIDRLVNGTSNEMTVGVAPTPPGASPTAGLNK
jgi:homoserine O-acetyltransferase